MKLNHERFMAINRKPLQDAYKAEQEALKPPAKQNPEPAKPRFRDKIVGRVMAQVETVLAAQTSDKIKIKPEGAVIKAPTKRRFITNPRSRR